MISSGLIYHIIQHLEDGLAEPAGGDLERAGPAVAEGPRAADREPHAPAAAQHLGGQRGRPSRKEPVGVPAVDVERRAGAGVDEVGAGAAREGHPRLQPRHGELEPAGAAAAAEGAAARREPVEVREGQEEEDAQEAVEPRPPPPPHCSGAAWFGPLGLGVCGRLGRGAGSAGEKEEASCS